MQHCKLHNIRAPRARCPCAVCLGEHMVSPATIDNHRARDAKNAAGEGGLPAAPRPPPLAFEGEEKSDMQDNDDSEGDSEDHNLEHDGSEEEDQEDENSEEQEDENSEEDQPDLDNLFPAPEEEDEVADLDAFREVQKFASLLLEDIGQNKLSQTAASRVLSSLRDTIGKFLPLPVLDLIPADWRGLGKFQATNCVDPPYVYRDFCPEDHHLFSQDPEDEVCPICKCATRYGENREPARKALYYTLEGYMRRILSSRRLRDAVVGWPDRVSTDGTLRDACDGSLMRGKGQYNTSASIFGDLCEHQRRRCFVFSECTDATVISHIQGMSMTPVVHMCLSLPPHLRDVLSAMFLGAVWPKSASDPVFLVPVLEMFSTLGPYGPGISIDGETYWAVWAFRVDDLRGIAKAIRAKTSPAYNGACIQCLVSGIMVKNINLTVYPGAVSHTPLGSEFRGDFKTSYQNLATIASLGDERKPPSMNKRKAMASINRQSAGNLSKEQKLLEPFHGPNIFMLILPYINFVWQTINDIFHEIANTIRDIFNLLRSNDKKAGTMHFNTKRKVFERDHGRFVRPPGKEGKGWRPPFQASPASRKKVDSFVQSGRMRLPSSWPRVRYVFDYMNRLSCSELVFLAGPLGVYLLQFPDIDDGIRGVFTDLLWCLEELQAKSITIAELDRLQDVLVLTLAEAETLLPVYWNTHVRHVLLHLTSFIKRCGPFKAFSMCSYERFHTMFKKLIRGRKNVLVYTHDPHTHMVRISWQRSYFSYSTHRLRL